MQLSLFDIPVAKIELEELFNAYFECRKNKRNTANALAFEIDYENNLVQLCKEINDGTYQIGRSIAFIVDKPVKREIFAADFRDRVVHHLVIGKLNHLFEKQFIHDSYSQVFANFYMDSFDHYCKHDLRIRYYGRYVDDFVIVHEDKEYLKNIVPKLAEFLQSELQTTIHPKKIYLQHYSKGVKFLGTVILPNRIYIADRTKGNFYTAIEAQNKIARDHKPTKEEQQAFQGSMNSYLGIMKHYKSYKLRKQMIFKHLSGWWWNYVYLSGGICKFEMKTKTV